MITRLIKYGKRIAKYLLVPAVESTFSTRSSIVFFKNGPTPASFSFIFVFSNTHYNCYIK